MRAVRGGARLSHAQFRFAVSCVAVACFVTASSAEAQSWPRSAGDTSNPQCVQAGALARAAFQSTNSWLFWPIDIPQGLGSTVILRRREKDGGVTSETKGFTADIVGYLADDPLVAGAGA